MQCHLELSMTLQNILYVSIFKEYRSTSIGFVKNILVKMDGIF
jgi:hypothetical protein